MRYIHTLVCINLVIYGSCGAAYVYHIQGFITALNFYEFHLFWICEIKFMKCDRICQNPPLTHTMAKNVFHHQSIALSIS